MPYYFVVYQEDDNRRVLIVNEIIQQHPVVYLKYVRDEFPSENYAMLFWSEIPDDIGESMQEHFE